MSATNFKLLGVDVFVNQASVPAELAQLKGAPFKLKTISNRGTKIWPPPAPSIHLTDVYGCRFMAEGAVTNGDVLSLLEAIDAAGYRWVHVEKLHEINGKPGFSAAQGE